jgi:hypothetical protein
MRSRIAALACLFAFAVLCIAADVKRQKGTKWETAPATLVSDITHLPPTTPAQLDKYGGLSATTLTATGFFHTQRSGRRWWLVDPDGHPFISVGICSVNLTQSNKHVAASGYADAGQWADASAKLLRDNSFNTLGCWSDDKSFTGDSRMPYCTQWDFISEFAKKLGIAKSETGHTGFPNDCMPIFNPDFQSFCDDHAKQLAATKDDPWLLGHFSDNELPFFPTSLHNFLSLPPDDPGHVAAQQWLNQRHPGSAIPRTRYDQTDQNAFLQFMAERYYTVIGSAIRKYDPNHLYLGSRLYGKTICDQLMTASKTLDVVSVNYYAAWSADQGRMSQWSQLSGKPVLVSEWYAMKLDSPAEKVEGAGFRVSTEAERGMFYQNFAISLLRNPSCVGWQWFKYGGDTTGRQIGCVDPSYQPHEELFKYMQEMNGEVYPLARQFSGG